MIRSATMMQAIVIFFSLLGLAACGGATEADGNGDTCERAQEHYQQCTGEAFEPGATCDEQMGETILSSSCEELEAAGSGKGDDWLGELLCGWGVGHCYFRQVSIGNDFQCGVRTNAKLRCWGSDRSDGRTRPPEGRFEKVSLGEHHGCALNTSGRIQCWGQNEAGQADPPAGTFVDVASGDFHTCGLKSDGQVVCWGSMDDVDVPRDDFTQISSGGGYSCGLTEDGALSCWGARVASAPEGTFRYVEAGFDAACAIEESGGLVCWNAVSNAFESFPTPVLGTSYATVAVADGFACALNNEKIIVGKGGTLECWGEHIPKAPSYSYIYMDAKHGSICTIDERRKVKCRRR